MTLKLIINSKLFNTLIFLEKKFIQERGSGKKIELGEVQDL